LKAASKLLLFVRLKTPSLNYYLKMFFFFFSFIASNYLLSLPIESVLLLEAVSVGRSVSLIASK